MFLADREIGFDYGHRVFQHESKCRNAHGHRGMVHFYASGVQLDNLGRVIDFSVLKDKLGGFIDDKWDHGFIYYEKDNEIIDALSRISGQKTYPLPFNPTAENLAFFLMYGICPRVLVDTGVVIDKIVFWETPNCSVELIHQNIISKSESFRFEQDMWDKVDQYLEEHPELVSMNVRAFIPGEFSRPSKQF